MLLINKNVLKSLFRHKQSNQVNLDEMLLKELTDNGKDKSAYDFLFNRESDLISNECCKSKDKTCATIECSHNFNRNGSGAYFDKYC